MLAKRHGLEATKLSFLFNGFLRQTKSLLYVRSNWPSDSYRDHFSLIAYGRVLDYISMEVS